MKTVSKKNISALLALLLAGTIFTSAKSESIENLSESTASADAHYIEYVDEYVDDYFEEMEVEEMEVEELVKVYGENSELLVSGVRSELSVEELQILRQADLLIEQSGTEYYQLNN